MQYQRHVERVHLKVRKNTCAECGAKFYEKRDLVRHCDAAHLHIKTLCPIEGCNKVNNCTHILLQDVCNFNVSKSSWAEFVKERSPGHLDRVIPVTIILFMTSCGPMNQGLKDGYVSTGIDSSFSEISLKFLNINLEES